MKGSRVLLFQVSLALAFAGAAFSQESLEGPTQEWSAAAVYRFPGAGDFDVYGSGVGGELQYRIWSDAGYGVGLAIGAEEWEAADEHSVWGGEPAGSATLFPAGFSVLAMLMDAGSVRLVLEAGLRYVTADSGVTLDIAGREYDVELEDGIVGVFGLDAETGLGEESYLFAGITYQADISMGGASIPVDNLRDNQLQAFGARLGVRLVF